jgi:hypothetical protein
MMELLGMERYDMTWEEVDAELRKEPFVALRLHLVSGKVIEVVATQMAWMLSRSVMVLQELAVRRDVETRYDLISLDHIERIEQLP